jgi:hypothetical protein
MARLPKTAFLFLVFLPVSLLGRCQLYRELVLKENNSSQGTMQRRRISKEITPGPHVILKKTLVMENLAGEGAKVLDLLTIEGYRFVSHAAMNSNEPSIPGLRNV